MGRAVEIKLEAQVLRRKLRRAVHRAGNLEPAFERIGKELLRSIRKTFRAAGRPQKWIARKPQRRGAGRRGRPLVKTGALRDSITAQLIAGGVEVGSTLPYAATHQYGRTWGRGSPIPARPYLVVQDEDRAEFDRIIERYLLGDLRS